MSGSAWWRGQRGEWYVVAQFVLFVLVAIGPTTWQSRLTLAYAALLFLLFDAKARREERWLVEKFPSYADYQRRVRTLVPFVY